MVDILNCSKGCIYGTATDPERNTDDVMLTLSKMRNSKLEQSSGKKPFGKKSKSPWAADETPEQRPSAGTGKGGAGDPPAEAGRYYGAFRDPQ